MDRQTLALCLLDDPCLRAFTHHVVSHTTAGELEWFDCQGAEWTLSRLVSNWRTGYAAALVPHEAACSAEMSTASPESLTSVSRASITVRTAQAPRSLAFRWMI